MEPYWYMIMGGALLVWPNAFRYLRDHLNLGQALRKSYMAEAETPDDLVALMQKMK